MSFSLLIRIKHCYHLSNPFYLFIHKIINTSTKPPTPKPITLPTTTLQAHFDNLLKKRGYSTNNYCSLENAYYNKPTPLQIASHGVKVIQAVRKSDKETIRKLLSIGLSPNPCNKFGESIIHMICRRGDHELLRLFMDHGCNLQMCDDFGRTPLHDACWTSTPNFEIVELILGYDRRLMNIVDCRGSSPLNYVKKDFWGDWVVFLDRVKERFWAERDWRVEGEEPPPNLVGRPPDSVPLSVTCRCKDVVVEEVALVAMGKLEPESLMREKKSSGNGGSGGGITINNGSNNVVMMKGEESSSPSTTSVETDAVRCDTNLTKEAPPMIAVD